MALTFPQPIRGWDLRRNVVAFLGEDGRKLTSCAISMEALVDHIGAGKGGKHASLAPAIVGASPSNGRRATNTTLKIATEPSRC